MDLSPTDIDVIIHTHLHNNHCENAENFVHVKELERIHNPYPLDYRYVEDYIEDVEKNGQIRKIFKDSEIFSGLRVFHTPVHTEGGLTVMIDTSGGKAAITGFCVVDENFNPQTQIKVMEMEVIPSGTHVNVYESYDIMMKIKDLDILIALHEPKFASIDTIF